MTQPTDSNNIIKMSRSTTLQRLAVPFVIFLMIDYVFIDTSSFSNIITYGIYFAAFILFIIAYKLLTALPLIQIYFDPDNDRLTYFRFLLFKKELPISIINDVVAQTKTSRKYEKGKSTTHYQTDIFLITDECDYQINVWERAKLNEFKIKLKSAKERLIK